MKLLDRLALIRAGYSKKEIAEIEAAEKGPEQPEPEQQPEEPETPAATEEPDTPDSDPEPTHDDVDYKQLYEDVKKQLADAQKVNVALAVGAGKDKDDDLTAWEKVINEAL